MTLKHRKEISLHGDYYMKGTVELQMNLASLIQLYNAALFTGQHKEDFLKEVSDCEHCFQAIDEFIEYAAGMIEDAEEHRKKDHSN